MAIRGAFVYNYVMTMRKCQLNTSYHLSIKLLCFFIRLSCSSDLDADVIIIWCRNGWNFCCTAILQEGGINDILILEGNDEVGGRVSSVEFGGVTVSLGATWIQGIDPAHPELHPTYQIAQRCGGLRGVYQNYTSLIPTTLLAKRMRNLCDGKSFMKH